MDKVWNIIAADLDGDARVDLAISSEHGTLGVLLNNGDGTLQDGVDYETGEIAWLTTDWFDSLCPSR